MGGTGCPAVSSLTRSQVVTGLLILATFVLLGVGFALFNSCDGGNSLIVFGVAVACLGAALFRTGAWATIVPIAIATLTLVGAGWYGATVGGCPI
jgi:hypothetical protein